MEMLNNGILSIDETEGEEISLTAEAPQLTEEERLRIESEKEEGDDEDVKRIDLFASEEQGDPLNNLLLGEDGITTLFQAKDGGTPQLAQKSKNGKRSGYRGDDAYGGGFAGQGSGASGPAGGASSSGNYGGSQNTGGGNTNREQAIQDSYKEASRKSDLEKTIAEGPGSDVEKYDTDKQRQQDKYSGTTKGQIKKGQDIVNTALEKYNVEKNKFDEKYQKKVRNKIIGAVLGQGMTLGLTDVIGAIVDGMKVAGAKNDLLDSIDTEISNLKELGIPNFTPHTDTPIQTLEQLEIDLTQKDREDDVVGGDGPVPLVEQIMASNQVIEERDETDIFNIWDKIKSKQAQRALLVEKGIIQDNENMMLNSGGLANLFRVKTQ